VALDHVPQNFQGKLKESLGKGEKEKKGLELPMGSISMGPMTLVSLSLRFLKEWEMIIDLFSPSSLSTFWKSAIDGK